MQANLINPFLLSIHNVMETMLSIKPEQSIPFAKTDSLTSGDISGVIGFIKEDFSGAVALSFPKITALRVFNLLTGEHSSRLGADVQDAIGEMANMVAGGAKSELSKHGISFHLTIPTVVVGRNHIMNHLDRHPVIVVPMSISGDKFTMEIVMKVDSGKISGGNV
ncbi:MAG: chemotaxis protein CheX [candidate division Zixibacteria bacterium]